MAQTLAPSAQPLPASRKVYVAGSHPGVRVPMREITRTLTAGRYGQEENPPVRVYDTSGPYTDPTVTTDIRRGLPALRRPWDRRARRRRGVRRAQRPAAGQRA